MQGFKCKTCRAEFNAIEPPCPNCDSSDVHKLTQLVPFSVQSGHQPDFMYYCICGQMFQHSYLGFDPMTKDLELLKKARNVKCPFCGRHNDHKLNWYLP
jgi:DNA-directed RNA polymerase subunit RPC12/RpoP